MKVAFAFVPPGGGETDYGLEFEMEALPQKGDYISILRDGEKGMEDFVVRRIHWGFEVNAEGKDGRVTTICVECEFAEGSFSSESHRKAVERYEHRTGKRLTFDVSVY
ncbi:alpha/beta hydrolase [Pseudomonas aeruginosa]|uniref:alpha/beta hydrolase n=1 Tax=Pseudomonas aeruginosa TaxID=287 RepID=UPI000BB6D6B1|nr:alpha/beta hydrolase [Pseudomonas aeruginosa]AXR09972.1 alpha/beta hydrolase [Pseudomonas aeruginosa]EIU2598508.1 hypothetical protein [Pseudomonas aeruginosa]EIU2879808.1 hypothetical protein [Pseudomonas aeruginosa]ELC7283625.1 hypothetical protein [Pseudomonas aeruginosa]ELK4865849.1 hypothetical protein [Pseudomonas aeruginosa]